MRWIDSSTSRGATIMRSASSSTITSRYGYGAILRSEPGSGLTLPARTALLKSSTCLNPNVRQVVVARVHLAHHPVERLGGLLGVGDDRRDEVRDALVDGQLDALGVDEHHAHLVGRGAHEDRGDHRVDEARLARAGGAGDEQVRHLGEVRDDVAALDVLADADDHRVLGALAPRWLRSTSPSDDGLAVGVGDLDADRATCRGSGDRMRTSALATAYAMFLLSAVTRSTLTAGPSSTSYRVTVGPRREAR